MYEIYAKNNETGDFFETGYVASSLKKAASIARQLKKESPHCTYEVVYDMDEVVYSTK
jgi:hypothetical protein